LKAIRSLKIIKIFISGLQKAAKKIFEAHKITHNRAFGEKLNIVGRYDEDEQAVILRFLMDINSLVEASFEKFYADHCDRK